MSISHSKSEKIDNVILELGKLIQEWSKLPLYWDSRFKFVLFMTIFCIINSCK